MASSAASVYVLNMRRFVCLIGSLVCMAATGTATSTMARTFFVIQSGPESWTVMDTLAIETLPGPGVLRQAWAVRVQRNILTGNPPQPGYVRTLSEYDCDQTRVRWREFSAYSRSGSALISNSNPDPQWGPPTEAGETYSAFKIVCQGGGRAAVVSADSVAKVVIGLMASWDPPPPPAKPLTMKALSPRKSPIKGTVTKKPSVLPAKATATKLAPVARP